MKIGKSFPLFELTIVLYLLQYGIAPLLEYNYNPIQSMAVPKEYYLSFATYSCIAFASGLLCIKSKFKFELAHVNPFYAGLIGRMLLFLGLLSELSMYILPESLRSVINFFILLKIIGIYSLIFSERKIDKIIVVLFFIQIAISSILGGMLIEFIIFSIFFSIFFGLRYKITSKFKIIGVIFSLLFLIVYQGIKSDYREVAWSNELSFQQEISLMKNLITFESIAAAFNSDISNNESLIKTIHRLNQGWQTSMVLNHVPSNVNFEYGNEIINDIFSSIMPRALWPEKREVNDYKRFNYYTGYSLNKSTSMSIGVLGDFYINFGFYGTLLSIFLLGILLSKIFVWFYISYIKPNPINIIWLPFIFSYLIRPGNEFYMVLNHLMKSLIIFYFIQKFVLAKINLSIYNAKNYD